MQQMIITGAGHPYPGATCLDGGRSPDRPCSPSSAYTSESQGRGYRSPVSVQSGACHQHHQFPNKSPQPENLVTLIDTSADRNQTVILTNTANLSLLTFQIVNQTKRCNDDYIVSECECGRHIYPKSCMSVKCTKCAEFAVMRRAKRAFERLTFCNTGIYRNTFGAIINYTVFTLPPSIREKYIDPKQITLLRAKLWNLLKTKFGGFFGIQATHPIGNESGNVFNPHLNFLWRQRPGFRNFIDVNKLRAEYKEILGIDFDPDCHHNYYDDPKQIMHKCKYVLRAFPQFVDWIGNIQWYGSFPHIDFSDEFICGDCMQKFRIIGTIAGIEVRDYEALGVNAIRGPPWENDALIRRFKSNPTQTTTSEKEIIHLFDD